MFLYAGRYKKTKILLSLFLITDGARSISMRSNKSFLGVLHWTFKQITTIESLAAEIELKLD